jgi:hypothetical protein
LQGIVDSLWSGFVQSLQIYAWSIGGGAALFGIGGAILGEGAGAVPGTLLGAKIGMEVASAILLFLGLRFLAQYVVAHLAQANEHFQHGLTLAWEACGEHPLLESAAQEIGRAIAELFSLVLEAAAAWVIKKGLKAGLQDLKKSKVGQALIPYAKVEFWRNKLGVTDAPVPRRGIATTIRFFEDQLHRGKLDPMDEAKLESYWKAMDFSKEVTSQTLNPGKELVGYRDPQSPFGFYYTEPGTYLDRVGIDYVTKESLPKDVQGPAQLVDREFIRYRVKQPVEVLKSTASGVRAWDTQRAVPGGGTQYFIPKAWEVLEVVSEGVRHRLEK